MKKPTTVRWTLKLAAAEFGPTERTIKQRLNQLGITPGAGGMFSTRQIHSAICDFDADIKRRAKADADGAEMDVAERKRKLVPVSELIVVIGKFLSAARARIDGDPKLDREEKDKIIEDLGKCLDVACGMKSPQTKSKAQSATTD
jgi:hypothetical protein